METEEKFMGARDNLDLLDFSKSTHDDALNKIRGLLDGIFDPCDVSEQCDRWVRNCYRNPKQRDQILYAINDLLDCHGVEVIWEGDSQDNGAAFDYCNTGDSYALTVAYDYEFGEYIVACWEDMAIAAMENEDDRESYLGGSNSCNI